MNDPGRRVTLLGRTTPVFLRNCGPEVSEADLAAFEATLGYPLPDDYRDFLLRYNGGRPSVIAVTGRDDDPTVPYAHGDGVRGFYKLQTAAGLVKNYQRLISPREYEDAYGLGFPSDALQIGDDDGGNMIMLELAHPQKLIRFVDHERLDRPFV